MKAPCYGCGEREPPDCHVHCEKYKEFQRQLALRAEAKEKKNASTPCLGRPIVKKIWRELKGRR